MEHLSGSVCEGQKREAGHGTPLNRGTPHCLSRSTWSLVADIAEGLLSVVFVGVWLVLGVKRGSWTAGCALNCIATMIMLEYKCEEEW
jgi:hypothetical protein